MSGVPDEVAALLFEPVLNVGGMAMPAAGYLQAAVSQFRASGALVVVDEIFTGFHRVGPRFGFELHGLKPDIVVLSKALTNGAAGLSAVWAREPLLDPDHFAPGTHSSTFSGTPFMLSVVDAVLDRFADREAWSTRVADLEASLRELVAEAAEAAPTLVEATGVHGGVARLLLRAPVAWDVRTAALDTSRGSEIGSPGVLLASTGMAPDVIAVHPPLIINAEDLAVIRGGLIRALRSLV
jgi:adenosylmethionine-8-amino-7-oxononanoate aminotransferase